MHPLTGLRFLAALGVVLRHYLLIGALHVPALAVPLIYSGRDGVGLFFVLSGYVIAYNYRDRFAAGADRRGAFFQARIARIMPMHLVGLALITPLSLLLVNPLPGAPPGLVVLSWLVNAAGLHAWVPVVAFNRWNVPSWSISAELFFYALFPSFASTFLRRDPPTRKLVVLGLTCFAIGGFVLILLALVAPAKLDAAWYLPETRVWEFLIGCVLGTLRLRFSPEPRWWRGPLLVGVLIGLVAAAYLPLPGVLAKLSWYVLCLPLFVLLIAQLGAGPSWLGRLLADARLVGLGEASYSLYLLHWIPLTLVVFAAQHHDPVPGWTVPAIVALTIAASLATYRWVETPARRWIRALPLDGRSSRDGDAPLVHASS
jgi:peptidoglycan/LPS O-acetylase OafA/YrhL